MQNFSTIVGVVELHQNGCSYRTIQSRYHIGAGTVALILKRFQDIGIPLNGLRTMNPKEVEHLFYPPENRRNTSKAMPDFFVIHEMMANMKRPDLAFIWLDRKLRTQENTFTAN